MKAHYSVYSNELDKSCIVFNARNRQEAQDEALNQVFGEILDNYYNGDAASSDYDPKTDLEVTVLCDDRTVRAIEDRAL